MYGSLHGIVLAHLENRCLIEVAGVGYWVQTGAWQPSGEILCYLHHHIREDASDLYGFAGLDELALFERLISISGIGPKAALALLSLGTASRLRQAIELQDAKFLAQAPGIGAKAAQKVILELSGKLPELSLSGDAQTSDLRLALESLGYKPGEILDIIANLPEGSLSLDEQIKWALQTLSRR
jgi:Holliday junction DNA helicase RuvA